MPLTGPEHGGSVGGTARDGSAAPQPRRRIRLCTISEQIVARTAPGRACTVGTTRMQALGTAPPARPSRCTAALKALRGAWRRSGAPARTRCSANPPSADLLFIDRRKLHLGGPAPLARLGLACPSPVCPSPVCPSPACQLPLVADPGPPAVGGYRWAERRYSGPVAVGCLTDRRARHCARRLPGCARPQPSGTEPLPAAPARPGHQSLAGRFVGACECRARPTPRTKRPRRLVDTAVSRTRTVEGRAL